jgi:hypothetical protein
MVNPNITEPLSPNIRGIKYPLTVSNGNLATSVDYDLITQQVRSVVETRYYERVMRAEYGIGDYILEILEPGLINSAIETSIQQNVDGLSSLSVRGDWTQGDDGLYVIFIEYGVGGVPQPPLRFTLAN